MTGSRGLATATFLRLWATAFAFFLSFYLLLPTIPLYARALGIPESQIGLIVGFFAFTSMAVRPWAGWAADRNGRRSFLAAGALLFLASSLLYGWPSPFAVDRLRRVSYHERTFPRGCRARRRPPWLTRTAPSTCSTRRTSRRSGTTSRPI